MEGIIRRDTTGNEKKSQEEFTDNNLRK